MAWPRYIRRNVAAAAQRTLYFTCVDAADGHSPENGEAGEQPLISIDGGAYSSSGVGVLEAVDAAKGKYKAVVTQATVNINGPSVIEGYYKSAATREAWSDNVLIVGGSLHEAIAALTNSNEVDQETGHTTYMEADGSTTCFVLQDDGEAGGDNTHTLTRA